MSIRHNILEAINSKRDDFYYKANDAERELFALKELTDNEDTIKKLERLIIDLNNIRMEEYRRDAVVSNYIDLPYNDFGAQNTIGKLKDGRLFTVTDDNEVYIVNVNMSLEELKDVFYKDDQDLWKQFSNNFEKSNQDIESSVLIEIGRN